MPIWQTAFIVLACPAVWLLTKGMRAYAIRHGIMDLPVARSSHTRPTPRGGGAVIALILLSGLAAFALAGRIETGPAAALCGGGLLVAGIGWLDDKHSLNSWLRLGVHAVAAGWALFWVGGIEKIDTGSGLLALGPAGWAVSFLWLVWSVNLYNFMDGIDGLAGAEACFAGLAGGLFVWARGGIGLAAVCWLLAAASLGFLFCNWSPARIFLGDVGSGLLGYSFGVIALYSERQGFVPLSIWLILLGVFVVDSTATLIRRMARGEKWTEPHRSHAYQEAVKAGYGHGRVTLAVLAIDAGLATVAGICLVFPGLSLVGAAAVLASLLWYWWIWTFSRRARMQEVPAAASREK